MGNWGGWRVVKVMWKPLLLLIMYRQRSFLDALHTVKHWNQNIWPEMLVEYSLKFSVRRLCSEHLGTSSWPLFSPSKELGVLFCFHLSLKPVCILTCRVFSISLTSSCHLYNNCLNQQKTLPPETEFTTHLNKRCFAIKSWSHLQIIV